MEDGVEDRPPSELVGGGGIHVGGRNCPTTLPKLDGVCLGEQRTPKVLQGGGCREKF